MTVPKRNRKAFTLIELLVVISIIGILAAIATVSFNSSQKQARDTERMSDLKMYQNALELYANDPENNGLYPVETSSPEFTSDDFCLTLGITGSCPNDAKYEADPVNFLPYQYLSSDDGTEYVLFAQLEKTSGYWVVCSTGSNFISESSPSLASCQ